MSRIEALPPKHEVAETLLSRGNVFIHLDPRLPGVRVPAWLADRPQLVLQVGLDMPVPIPDLCIDDDGVTATLSFSRQPHACSVPWAAVFALVGEDGQGMVWPEDLPAEVAAEVEREARRHGVPAPPRLVGLDADGPAAAGSPDRPAPAAPPLRVVDGGARSSGPDGATGRGATSRARRTPPPWLRRVK